MTSFPPKPNEEQQPAQQPEGSVPPAPIPPAPIPQVQVTPTPPPQGIPVKIFVAIPCKDLPLVDFRFVDSWHQVQNTMPPGSYYMPAWQYGIAETRQKLVEHFLAIPDATHILFWDTDTIAPISVDQGKPVWLTMLEANHPIVSGTYLNSLRTGMNAWVGGRPINPATTPNAVPLVDAEDVGFGFIMIYRGIIQQLVEKNIPKPWFSYRSSANPAEMLSEDFYFLRLIWQHLQIRPKIDTRIRCIHIKTYGYNTDGTIAG